MASLLPFLFLSLALFNFLPATTTATAAPTQRHLLRSLADGSGPAADAAVDLNATTFDDALRTSPTSYAIVEFFAHWCPACRNYKPQYEKVARLFNGPDAAHPGIVLMTRVDCAMKANADLCDRFSVGHYPMLLWGPPAKFVNAKWDPKQDKSDIQPIDDGRTSQRLLNWINKRIGSSFNLDDEKYENENLLPRNASDPGQIARAIFDVEEATAKAFEIILEHKMIKPETRAPLIKFFQLLAAHHPSKKCRMGSAELLVNFDEMWPSSHLLLNSEAATHEYGAGASEKIAVCGKEVPHGYWIFCRGSKNDTRGFSCGLWVLMHSLSVRIEDGESHLAFTAIRDFIHNFFICEECCQHFYDMCLSVKSPFESTRALSLWLWQAHNKVNERLMKEEKNLGTGDPSFPKSLWPPHQLCPTCYLSPASSEVQWNEDEVFKFLVKYYGQTLASPSTKKAATGQSQAELLTTNDSVGGAVSAEFVPVWAALGIALASVTFGALACFWRAQQKNRKQRRNWT